VSRFIASLIPVHQLGAVHSSDDRHNLIAVHTLAQAALIRLFYLRAEVDQLWNEKCVHAARGMLSVIGQVSDMDIEFLDPIVGVSLPSSLWFSDQLIRTAVLLGFCGARIHPGDRPDGVVVASYIQRTRKPCRNYYDCVVAAKYDLPVDRYYAVMIVSQSQWCSPPLCRLSGFTTTIINTWLGLTLLHSRQLS
jgi:hypothetical protein